MKMNNTLQQQQRQPQLITVDHTMRIQKLSKQKQQMQQQQQQQRQRQQQQKQNVPDNLCAVVSSSLICRFVLLLVLLIGGELTGVSTTSATKEKQRHHHHHHRSHPHDRNHQYRRHRHRPAVINGSTIFWKHVVSGRFVLSRFCRSGYLVC
mmetsp:Transcript_18289/g.20682  ORF Transcript_18289/g.20682 Transcript_18289/m.20682 type:complete len:151 (+) Transcript_18289:269-721(+)